MEPEIATIIHRDRETIIEAHGEIDMANGGELRAAIEPELGPGIAVVVDLSDVTYLDSTGLNVLIESRRSQHRLGGTFTVPESKPHRPRLLTVTSLEFLLGEEALSERLPADRPTTIRRTSKPDARGTRSTR